MKTYMHSQCIRYVKETCFEQFKEKKLNGIIICNYFVENKIFKQNNVKIMRRGYVFAKAIHSFNNIFKYVWVCAEMSWNFLNVKLSYLSSISEHIF